MAAPIQSNEPSVRITAKPDLIFIEKSTAGQYLNSDFIVENLTTETWRMSHIEVSLFDVHARLVLRKFVNESGGIQTIPSRVLQGKASLLVFNPFFFFDHSVELDTLRFTFTFSSGAQDEDDRQSKADVVISPVYYETKTNLMLPVGERVIIWDGHDFYSHHRRFDYRHPMLQHYGFKTNFQRYGYDFVPVDQRGEMVHGDAENNEAWFGFGASIDATADGRVVDLFDGMPDDRRFDEAELATRETVVFGNYVVIDHLNGEYSCFGHLKQGSIRVTLGEEVQQGHVIAQIGASGSSLFPHLHYELRNGTGAKEVEGLPSYFHRFRRILGSKTIEVEYGQIDTGDIVERQ